MQHAGPQDLHELTALLEAIRTNPDVKELRAGYFYCQGRSLTHFHVDPAGLFADARIGGKWTRFSVSAARERASFLALLEGEIRARR